MNKITKKILICFLGVILLLCPMANVKKTKAENAENKDYLEVPKGPSTGDWLSYIKGEKNQGSFLRRLGGSLVGSAVKFAIGDTGGSFFDIGNFIGKEIGKKIGLDLGPLFGESFEIVGNKIRHNLHDRVINYWMGAIAKDPAMERNWDKIYKDAWTGIIQESSEEILGTNFCTPQADKFAQELVISLSRPDYFTVKPPECDLETSQKNFNEWADKWKNANVFSYEDGWDSFVKLNSQNYNPYSSALGSLEYYINQYNEQGRKVSQRQIAGLGFFGDERWYKWHWEKKTNNLSWEKISDSENPFTCPSECKKINNSCDCREKGYRPSLIVAGLAPIISLNKLLNTSFTQYSPKECIQDTNLNCRLVIDKQGTATPGAVLAQSASNLIGNSDIAEIQNADTSWLQQAISKLVDTAIYRVVEWGVSKFAQDDKSKRAIEKTDSLVTRQKQLMQAFSNEQVASYPNYFSELEKKINNAQAILSYAAKLSGARDVQSYKNLDIYKTQLKTYRALKMMQNCLVRTGLVIDFNYCQSSITKPNNPAPGEEEKEKLENCLRSTVGCEKVDDQWQCLSNSDKKMFILENQKLIQFNTIDNRINLSYLDSKDKLKQALCQAQEQKYGIPPDYLNNDLLAGLVPSTQDIINKAIDIAKNYITTGNYVKNMPNKIRKKTELEYVEKAKDIYGEENELELVPLSDFATNRQEEITNLFNKNVYLEYGKAYTNSFNNAKIRNNEIKIDLCAYSIDFFEEANLQTPLTYCKNKIGFQTNEEYCKAQAWQNYAGEHPTSPDVLEYKKQIDEMSNYFVAMPTSWLRENNMDDAQLEQASLNRAKIIFNALEQEIYNYIENLQSLYNEMRDIYYNETINITTSDVQNTAQSLAEQNSEQISAYQGSIQNLISSNSTMVTKFANFESFLEHFFKVQNVDLTGQQYQLEYQTFKNKLDEIMQRLDALRRQEQNITKPSSLIKAEKWLNPTYLTNLYNEIFDEEEGRYFSGKLVNGKGEKANCRGIFEIQAKEGSAIYDLFEPLYAGKFKWIETLSTDIEKDGPVIQNLVDQGWSAPAQQ